MLPHKYFGALSVPSITLIFWQQFSLEAWPTYHYSTEVTHSIVITHSWLSQNSNKLVNGVKICTGNTNGHSKIKITYLLPQTRHRIQMGIVRGNLGHGVRGNPSHVIIIMASLILQNLASCLNLQVKLHVSYENKHRKR